MEENIYKNYLRDLGFILSEMAFEAVEKRKSAMNKEQEDYSAGYLVGFYRVISLMQQQAEGFQIPLKDICLDKIDAEKDLL